MKQDTNRLSLPLLLVTLLFGIAGALRAQVPDLMAYQGFLTDTNGDPVAPSTPENRDVVFRIYDSPSNGTVVWAESQTVTIFQGNFSVLLGNGATSGTDPKPPLAEVFSAENGSMRYMGIKLDTNPEFSPRQQITTNAWAFRAASAKSSDSVGGGLNFNFQDSDPNALTWNLRTFSTTRSDFDGDTNMDSGNDVVYQALSFLDSAENRGIVIDNSGHLGANSISTNGINVTGGGITATRMTIRPRQDGNPNPDSYLDLHANNGFRWRMRGTQDESLEFISQDGFPGRLRMGNDGVLNSNAIETNAVTVTGGGIVTTHLTSNESATFSGTTLMNGGLIGVHATDPGVSFLVRGTGGDAPFRVEAADGSNKFQIAADGSATVNGTLSVEETIDYTGIGDVGTGQTFDDTQTTNWKFEIDRGTRSIGSGFGEEIAVDPDLQLRVRRTDIEGNPSETDTQVGYFDFETGEYTSLADQSDIRLKKDIQPVNGILESLTQMSSPVSYLWKDGRTDGRDEGFIAQDVEKVFPGLIKEVGKNGMKGISYSRLGVYAIGAIQEQHVIVEQQAKEIEALEKQNEDLEARLERLEFLLNEQVR